MPPPTTGPPMTAGDILSLALFDAGIVGTGQVASAQDSNLALVRLNFMLGEWNRKRWLIYHLNDFAVTSTGAQFYTIGPGGDIPMVERPDRIEKAFFRQLVQSQPNQIDYSLDLLEAREDYDDIALKQLQSFPMVLFYDSAYPLGKLYPWPVMQPNIYELHVNVKEILGQIPSLVTLVSLPIEYYNAIHWNMVVRLMAAYGIPADGAKVALAKEALASVRGAETQIARLRMPTDLQRPGIYNPYSDQIR